MKKIIIIVTILFSLLILLTLLVFPFSAGYGQETPPRAMDSDSLTTDKTLVGLFKERGNNSTMDTLADGSVMIEITESPNQPDYRETHAPLNFRRSRGKIVLLGFLAVIFVVCLPVLYFTKWKNKKVHKKYLERLQAFKQQAYKIPVNLNDCKIKERTRYERIYKSYRQQQNEALDEQFFSIQRNDTKELHCCTVTFEAVIDDKTETFCVDIDKDELTLRILFAQRKTTCIYVDTQNKENYYFDLEFLN